MLRPWVLAVAVLVLSGCQLRLDVGVEVNRNGGGTLGVSVGADAELLELAESADADPLGDLAAAGAELRGDGWRVSDDGDDEGGRTVTLRRSFADPGEFNSAAAQLAEALSADEVVLLEPLTLEVGEGAVALTGGAGAEPRRAVRDYGLSRGRAIRLVSEQDALAYTVTVVMPGEVTSTNATEQDGSRLVWRVAAGESVAIAAESTRPGPPWVRGALGAAGGALVAGGLLWLWSRRRRPAGGQGG